MRRIMNMCLSAIDTANTIRLRIRTAHNHKWSYVEISYEFNAKAWFLRNIPTASVEIGIFAMIIMA